jgi:putative CRISPR-associated protein (TIGR02620 family)
MTTWFVSRHSGALQWMQLRGIPFDRHVLHLEPQDVHPGDTVIGSLSVNLAAEICWGAASWHLTCTLPQPTVDANCRRRNWSAMPYRQNRWTPRDRIPYPLRERYGLLFQES